MSIKAIIAPPIAQRLLSHKRLMARRRTFERQRIKAADGHCAEFFHDPSDPYSQLLQSVLPILQDRYAISIITHTAGPPSDAAAPERAKLKAYSKMDAMRLAKKAGLSFEPKNIPEAQNTQAADARLHALGHYMGATLYYGGEWYWGLDRLHYLEDRLTDLGLRHSESARTHIYTPPAALTIGGSSDSSMADSSRADSSRADSSRTDSSRTGTTLHWYVSFRSPYSAIVRDRVKALADTYGAKLKVRFVLPMVMRGLPVPAAKKKYIPLDTAREARRLGVAFGRLLDPVGAPVEMAYSLLPWAREQGLDYAYTQSWLAGVWSEGIDAGSHAGLRRIVKRADLDWNDAKHVLGDKAWRVEAEVNRQEMMERGIWGVPSFRIGDTITWGQDRLWVMEHALRKLSQ